MTSTHTHTQHTHAHVYIHMHTHYLKEIKDPDKWRNLSCHLLEDYLKIFFPK